MSRYHLRHLTQQPTRLLVLLAGALIATDLLIAAIVPQHSWLFGAYKHASLRPHIANAYHYFADRGDHMRFYDTLPAARVWPRAYAATPPADAGADNPFRRLIEPTFAPARPLVLERTSNTPAGLVDQVRRDGYRINNTFYEALPPYDHVTADPTDDIMLRALYCDRTGYDEHDWRILSLIGDHKGGYLDTHYLMALLLLRANGCHAVPQKLIDDTTTAIIAAQRVASVDDLFAERIVVLYWAGAGDRVPLGWIRTLAAAQRPDGGWRASVHRSVSDPHATGLAALALRYYLDGTATQPILPR